jgi:hypothetical protein
MAYENAVEPGAMSPRCCMESARSGKVGTGGAERGREGKEHPSLNLQFWSWLDTIAYGSVIAWFIGRIGCFFAHDHIGRRTSSWIGVAFPGGGRFDLGLLEALFLGILLILLTAVDRYSWSRRPGFIFGGVTFLYGIFRLLLENLRDVAVRYFGLTAEQYAAIVLKNHRRGGQGWHADARPQLVRKVEGFGDCARQRQQSAEAGGM